MLYQPILYTTKLTRQFEKAKSFLNKNPQIPLREQHIQHQVHGGQNFTLEQGRQYCRRVPAHQSNVEIRRHGNPLAKTTP